MCITSSDMTMRYCLAEVILKLGLNTISTGAHILKGKVYQNIMIDVRVRYCIFISYSSVYILNKI
jgi:N-acetylmuramic acid 6-phosphate (MurNAc-6-P) etherase